MFIKQLLVIAALFNCAALYSTEDVTRKPKKDLKVLVLIITSDHFPVYIELQKSWKAYMHSDRKHFESYFIRANPDLPTMTAIENDIIWSRTTEGWPPQSSGIIDKTVLSIEAMLPRLHEFDYVIRTNLSSFYVLPRLLEVLETLPRKGCYFGSSLGEGIASGCGFIMSTDVAKMLVDNKDFFIGNTNHDDILVGMFLRKKGVKLISHKRIDLLSLQDWDTWKNNLPSDVFHFRVKNDDAVRLVNDIYIHSELLKQFYPKIHKRLCSQ